VRGGTLLGLRVVVAALCVLMVLALVLVLILLWVAKQPCCGARQRPQSEATGRRP